MYQKKFHPENHAWKQLEKDALFVWTRAFFWAMGCLEVLNVDTDWMVDGTTKISLRC